MSTTPVTGPVKTNYLDRVEVESLNLVGAYGLKAGKGTDDQCPLCRQDLLAPTFEDYQKGNLKVVVSLGACNHCFHKTCIDAHCSKSNLSCPVDKTPWTLSKVITIADYIKRTREEPDVYTSDSTGGTSRSAASSSSSSSSSSLVLGTKVPR